MNENIKEIEVVTTVEITHIYNGKELQDLIDGDLLPKTPEELEDFKTNMADEIRRSIAGFLEADHVGVTNVQYFEAEAEDRNDD